MNTLYSRLFRSLMPFVCILAASASAQPREELELQEVVVTASLRQVSAAALPVSVTVLEASTLQRSGVQHLQDVLPLVPNLNWASGTSRPRYFQLRGIGETDQWQGAPNPSVGFLIDDMDFSGIGMPATLLDLGQVEVLRGPQGTTFGANALAGLINLRTTAPTSRTQARLESTLGEYGTAALGVVLGGAGPHFGADEASAWRLVAGRYRSDGFRRNLLLNRDDTNGFDEHTLRLRAAHRFGDRWRADLSMLWIDIDNGFDAFALDNSRNTLADDPGRDRQRSRGTSLRLERDGAMILRSVTAYVDADILYSFDGDWSFDPDYDFTSRFLRDRRSFTQDIRWLGTRVLEQPGDWNGVIGAYFLRVDENNDQLDLYAGESYRDIVSRYQADTLALYGSLERQLAPRWRLTAGTRVERRDTRYRDSDGADLGPGETMFGGNLSLEWRPSADRLGYLSLSRGYKGGGFNIGSVVPEERRRFDPELLYNLELGLKIGDGSGRWRSTWSIFYMRRDAQQVSTSAQLDPADPLTFIYLTDNAARGENLGLESSLEVRLAERWLIGATAGLLRTRFIDYQALDLNLTGRAQAHAPAHQFSLSLDYRHPVGWFARADAQKVAEFFFSDSHDQRSSAYTVLNARAGYAAGRWQVSLWVRNALDERYAQRGFFFGNEPPDFPDRLYVQLADPRQLGLSFSLQTR